MNGGGPQVTFSTTTSSKGESLARGNYSKTSECNVSSIFHTGIFFLLEITILEKKGGKGLKTGIKAIHRNCKKSRELCLPPAMWNTRQLI